MNMRPSPNSRLNSSSSRKTHRMRPSPDPCSEPKKERARRASDTPMNFEKGSAPRTKKAEPSSDSSFRSSLLPEEQFVSTLEELPNTREIETARHLKDPEVVPASDMQAVPAERVVASPSAPIPCITLQRDLSSRRPHAAVFDTVESAQQYLALLAEVVSETHRDAEAALQSDMRSSGASQQAPLQVLVYDLKKLANFLESSHRIVQDLLVLRSYLNTGDVKGN